MARNADLISELHVQIPAGPVRLEGDLVLPAGATAVVLFAHGSGSGRHSPRNRAVASVLQDAGLGTLLMDLLTLEEEAEDQWTGHLRFDVPLLAERLLAATQWLAREPSTLDTPGTRSVGPSARGLRPPGVSRATASMKIGYFGASTGAGAALVAAARRPARLGAVVSRGGRPDLAGRNLPLVLSPTLLIVGGEDHVVIQLNEQALAELTCEKRLEIVPGATHLFEEPGALERVSDLAREWFLEHSQAEGT